MRYQNQQKIRDMKTIQERIKEAKQNFHTLPMQEQFDLCDGFANELQEYNYSIVIQQVGGGYLHRIKFEDSRVSEELTERIFKNSYIRKTYKDSSIDIIDFAPVLECTIYGVMTE